VLQKASSGEPARVAVTFTHPIDERTGSVCVVGDFNDWSPDSHPMRIDGEQATCTITLPIGDTHRFRYLLDGERWENDWQADGYAPNDFGGDDSVIDLTVDATRELAVEPEPEIDLTTERAAPKKAKRGTKKAST